MIEVVEVVVTVAQGHPTTQPEATIQPMGGKIQHKDLQIQQATEPQGRQRIQLPNLHHQNSLKIAATILPTLYLQ